RRPAGAGGELRDARRDHPGEPEDADVAAHARAVVVFRRRGRGTPGGVRAVDGRDGRDQAHARGRAAAAHGGMMGDFHFLRPEWLSGIGAAVILLWLAARRHDLRRQWRGLIADHLIEHLIVAPPSTSRLRPVHLTSAALAIGSISAAGP